MSRDRRTEISIHGQVFRLRCSEGEEERLRAAAELVESKIAEVAQAGGLADSLRVALMAAFHLAYELTAREDESFRHSGEYKRIQQRLKTLVDEIDANLSP